MHQPAPQHEHDVSAASIRAGRRDDLWSWLYVLVELLDGTLPWRAEAGDRSLALALKQDCLRHPEHLTSNVPMPGAHSSSPAHPSAAGAIASCPRTRHLLCASSC